jgi:hypothetical protein
MNYTKHFSTLILLINDTLCMRYVYSNNTQLPQIPPIRFQMPSVIKNDHPIGSMLATLNGEPEAQSRLKRHTSFRVVIYAFQD